MRLSTGVGVLWVGLLMNTGCGGEAEDIAVAGSKLTYHRDIAPLLGAKCGACHAPGGIGPMPLSTYAEVSPAAGLIKTVVETGQFMFDAKYGQYSPEMEAEELMMTGNILCMCKSRRAVAKNGTAVVRRTTIFINTEAPYIPESFNLNAMEYGGGFE